LNKLADYVLMNVIKNINHSFDKYFADFSAAQNIINAKRSNYYLKEKLFRKLITKNEKIYQKGIKGIEQSDDIFIETSKFIN
jgi:hypothetical protein